MSAKNWAGKETQLWTDGAAHLTLATSLAGEVTPESATLSNQRILQLAKVTKVDASGGDVTDQAVSSAPAALLGWYVTAGSGDTLVVKNDATTVLSETVAAADNSEGIIPPGIALEFDTSLLVSLTGTAEAWIFWWPL